MHNTKAQRAQRVRKEDYWVRSACRKSGKQSLLLRSGTLRQSKRLAGASRGFTLIELLFVVAVIAILASIAVPNFLEAQTRSKISRAKVDMAVVSLGLSRYYVDHGVYVSNHPETLRYLRASMDNPVMDENHTSAPAEATRPWYKSEYVEQTSETEAMGEMFGLPGTFGDYTEHEALLPLTYNQEMLFSLTTPVNYLGHPVPRDPFGAYKTDSFSYINSAELFAVDSRTSAPGLWGDHLTSGTHYLLWSTGADGVSNAWHPVNGPWHSYDATNGTTSNGDIFVVEGRVPKSVEPPEEWRPVWEGRY